MSSDSESCSKVLSINSENVYNILDSNELVVIIFYKEYESEYSKYAPIINEAATKVSELYPNPGKVVFGKSRCYDEWTNSDRFKFRAYDLYVYAFVYGILSKTHLDYSSVQKLVSFVQTRLDGSIQEISSKCIPDNHEDVKGRVIIGYFKNKNSPEYQIFRKVSMQIIDICRFYAGFGESYRSMFSDNPNESLIVFKIANQPSPEFEQDIFTGNSSDYESLHTWGTRNCLMSTSEITFDNADDIRREIDSLVLFYNPDDLEPIKQFKDIIKKDLEEWCYRLNFLTANGITFSQKLQQIGKSITNLPFVLVFRYHEINDFPENFNFTVRHELKKYIDNFYSLHIKGTVRLLIPSYRFDFFSIISREPVKIEYMPYISDSDESDPGYGLFD